MSWWTGISSKFGLTSNILSFVFSQSYDISGSCFNRKNFARFFPQLYLHCSQYDHSPNLHQQVSFPSPSSPGCMYKDHWQGWCSLGQQFFSGTLITINSNFTFNVDSFHFFAALWSLLTNSLFQLSIFMKYYTGLTWGTRRQHSYMLCCRFMNHLTEKALYNYSSYNMINKNWTTLLLGD